MKRVVVKVGRDTHAYIWHEPSDAPHVLDAVCAHGNEGRFPPSKI